MIFTNLEDNRFVHFVQKAIAMHPELCDIAARRSGSRLLKGPLRQMSDLASWARSLRSEIGMVQSFVGAISFRIAVGLSEVQCGQRLNSEEVVKSRQLRL